MSSSIFNLFINTKVLFEITWSYERYPVHGKKSFPQNWQQAGLRKNIAPFVLNSSKAKPVNIIIPGKFI
jgi:hypothetical protein